MANIFNDLRKYAGKWQVKSSRNFSSEEIADVEKAEVVESNYGASVCFYLKSGDVSFMPLSSTSSKGIGEEINLEEAKVVTLSKAGESDIMRVEA